jgi:hypothetical protein
VRRRAIRDGWTFVALLLAHPLWAQEPTPVVDSTVPSLAARTVTLAGVVRDTAGHPLSGAEVRAGARQLTISDAAGRFELGGVAPDTIQLLVRRIGYLPAEVVLEAQAGLRVELAVKLVPATVELGTVVVEGRRMDTRLLQSGFYDRQKLGLGTYFTPDYLAHHGGSMDALMREVPSVRVTRDSYNRAVAMGPSGLGLCELNVFLDGILVRWAGDVGLDQLLDKHEVLAVEVYPRASQLPVTFAGYLTKSAGGLPSPGGAAGAAGGSDCGAIVIWSKPFEPEETR